MFSSVALVVAVTEILYAIIDMSVNETPNTINEVSKLKTFRKVAEAPEVEKPKRGRPVGAKNKGKAVTATKAKGSPYTGTYGRISGITHVELLDGVKYRIFDSGNVGTVNVRLKLHFANGESAIIGPASMTFLEDRDDAWRKANGKTNNRSALHVSELEDWSNSESDNWRLIIESFGERKIKAGEVSPVMLDEDEDED